MPPYGFNSAFSGQNNNNNMINNADMFGSNTTNQNMNNSILNQQSTAYPSVFNNQNKNNNANVNSNGISNTSPFGLDATGNPLTESQFNANESMRLKNENEAKYGQLLDSQIANAGTSWNDWANIGLGGLGTAMQMGMYGDRKDYLEGSVSALEQATQNSEEAHNTKQANNASYGSAFSG